MTLMMEMIALPNYADINGRPMKKLQIQQYLRKLQLNDFEPAINLATLTKLQDAHLKYIPYENFDCLNGKITSLKRQDMFNKVIMHNRGGICFELNGLYNWLLESLSFDVTSYSARFIDKMETYQPQIDKDFITASFWCDAHPNSPFIKSKKLSIFREDCNITIRGNYLKFYLGGRVKYRYKINTGAELKEILWEYFGINVEYRLKDDGIEY